MAKLSNPHAGSLQFWPRKRALKRIHSVNWGPVERVALKKDGVLGFIAYKVGMVTTVVKDNTEMSMTKGKKIYLPATILEVPPLKIFSVRFYNKGLVVKDVVVSNDKELKKLVKVPKEIKPLEQAMPKEYDNITIIAYSIPSKTAVKKTADIMELAIHAADKLGFVKAHLHKEIPLSELIQSDIVDIRGLTRGKGLVGPVKRFGINLKQHKTEKGVRRPGSLGPWHPHRVTFRVPQAGQLGMFSRVHYNIRLLTSGTIAEKNINPGKGFRHYGMIRSAYILVKGSVQGPPKRELLITPAFRPTKSTAKKKYEFVEMKI